MIRIEGIHRSFGVHQVLRGIDLEVESGRTAVLLGPSGVGKSTLLRIVAGLERADAGRVLIGDVDVTDVPTHRRGVGYLFQDLALFPHLDVGANVGFGLRMARIGRTERVRRVLEALELVGLPDAAERDPATLSGGERQRVALARALAPRPEVLLLDEPFGALDRTLRDRLLADLRALFDALGLTVLAVSHDPTEAATLGHRIAVLVDGSIQRHGAPADVFAAPGSGSVASVLGLGNRASAVASGGTVEVPGWGRFPAPLPDGPAEVMIPSRAVHVADPGADEDGLVRCVVDRVGVRDGEPTVTIRPTSGGPALVARSGRPHDAGDRVVVRIDADLVHVMAAPSAG